MQWYIVKLGRSLNFTQYKYTVACCRTRAIAVSRKLVLLTRNHRDLGKVPGLLIEDWTVSCDRIPPFNYFLCVYTVMSFNVV
ncbi:hypothetical protein [Nostoc sp. FACHB-133]|uniref:hypothetical protein n=1 Tax=Nostoc sp. FACHB-133 TaxID=2692835 RepID=UPI0018EF6DC3|nr:hypothetical protein [Nostoc sp. FACHB-133]MBD2520969.1 hypothetical protein [Nostoc sp. FACHB-133]